MLDILLLRPSLHFTPLHHTSLHFTTLHPTTLHYTSPHFTPLHYTSPNYTSLHFTTLHPITLHSTSLHFTQLHFTTLLFCLTPSKFPTAPFHLTSLHFTSLHLTSPYLTSPHLTSPHLTSPHLTSPHLTSPHLTSLHCTFRRFSPHFYSVHFTPFIIAFLSVPLRILGLKRKVPNASLSSWFQFFVVLFTEEYFRKSLLCLLSPIGEITGWGGLFSNLFEFSIGSYRWQVEFKCPLHTHTCTHACQRDRNFDTFSVEIFFGSRCMLDGMLIGPPLRCLEPPPLF